MKTRETPVSKKPAGERAPTGAQTLLRGLEVLDVVIDGPVPLNELAQRLQLTRSTTHRLATALVESRFLTFRPREGYLLGPKLLELGYCARQQIQLAQIARPALEALAKDTRDIVHFGILEDDMALYLDKVPGKRRVLISSRVGERQPLASTGLGKALLLDESEEELKRLFEVGAGGTAKPSDLAVWLERMRSYARGGYAFDLEENEDRIRCVAAPVRDVDGSIIASVSLSSAAQYMDDERMQALIPVVQATALRISRELGYAPAAHKDRGK